MLYPTELVALSGPSWTWDPIERGTHHRKAARASQDSENPDTRRSAGARLLQEDSGEIKARMGKGVGGSLFSPPHGTRARTAHAVAVNDRSPSAAPEQ